MNVSEAIETRLEIRTYKDRPVGPEAISDILEAGRLAPSGRNFQHWRFIVIEDADRLAALADHSPTGQWIGEAPLAIAICTDPQYDYHEIDAGRAVTNMQLAAWERGIGSCIFTVGEPAAAELLEIPDSYRLTLVAGFGYPTVQPEGRKDRKPIDAIAFEETFGTPIDRDQE